MKKILFILLVPFLFACNSKTQTSTVDSTGVDTVPAERALNPSQVITPGAGIGMLAIGLPVDSVLTELGKPDSSDAAMGSAMLSWYSKDNNKYRTAIFAHRDMGNDETSRIKLVMVSDPSYKTPDGIGTGAYLSEIEKNYTLKRVENVSAQRKGIQVFDDNKKGITFNIDSASKKCVTITVHRANDGPGNYINMY